MKRMGILGPAGTHSEAAAIHLNELLQEKFELQIFSTIDEAILSVEEGLIDSAFVPVENSLEGSVNVTIDTLAFSKGLKVARELIWRVHNSLMVKAGTTETKKFFHILKHYLSAENISENIFQMLKSWQLRQLRKRLKSFRNQRSKMDSRQYALNAPEI